MKAIIQTGGKQYSVEEGKVLYIEKIDARIKKLLKLALFSFLFYFIINFYYFYINYICLMI